MQGALFPGHFHGQTGSNAVSEVTSPFTGREGLQVANHQMQPPRRERLYNSTRNVPWTTRNIKGKVEVRDRYYRHAKFAVANL